MADDPIPAPVVRPRPRDDDERAPRSITCDFCACRLTRRGDVLEISERARALRALDDDLRAARERITTLQADLDAARNAPAPAPAPQPARAAADDGW